MTEKISVLLVDDHALVRRGFRRMLEDEEDIVVKGEASDGEEAVRLAHQLQPKVIVMDCALPGISGLVATRQILEHNPEGRCADAEHALGRHLGAAGAGGRSARLHAEECGRYGISDGHPAGGGREEVLDPQIARRATLKGERETGLTVRELEILQLIVGGLSNKEIATHLNLSANTVAVHRANIMDALGIHKTAELVVYAIRNGLVNIP